MAVNVEILRKAQATIADPNIPFDMSNWGCCIAGHINFAAGISNRIFWTIDPPLKCETIARDAAGLENRMAEVLFSSAANRLEAIESLEYLIQEELLERRKAAKEALDMPVGSALEPCAHRAAARAESSTPVEELELIGV